MSTIEREIELENTNAPQMSYDLTWVSPNAYRCHICTTREDDGTFSTIVLNLPGCGSCGDTEEEAIANAREAIRGVIESYLAADEEIPWQDRESGEISQGASQKWILVNA